MRLLAAIALALCLILPLPAVAGDAEDFIGGFSAYVNGDYAETLRLFRPLAEKGDTRAQILLGLMYDEGHGVPQDYSQAV